MYRRDYLVRMIEQMTEAMGQLMGLKRERKREEAGQTIDELFSRLFRLNSKLVNSLSEQDLIRLLSTNGVPETEKLKIVAALLQEEADLLEDEAKERIGEAHEPPPEIYRKRLRALGLYLYADFYGADTQYINQHEAIAKLLVQLQSYELPSSTKLQLWNYFESSGHYARAEDTLFELLETEDDELIERGVQFYNRLLEKTDAELAAGHLPREEVEAGLEQLRTMQRQEAKAAELD